METIHFTAAVLKVRNRLIVRLPGDASTRLSSRGQVAVSVKVKDHEQVAVLEPDGDWGHWMNITSDMHLNDGDVAAFEIIPTKSWPEPLVSTDIMDALKQAPQKVRDKWHDITPMARWEWVRWINATKNPDTRVVRIEKTISKLNGKHRRPCCFNLAACTDMELTKGSRLIALDM